MKYIIKSKVFFLAQGVPGIKQQSLNNITDETKQEKQQKLLTNAQHGKRTKSSAMKIEGKSGVFHLQPHKVSDQKN